jgi:hypothetical protein
MSGQSAGNAAALAQGKADDQARAYHQPVDRTGQRVPGGAVLDIGPQRYVVFMKIALHAIGLLIVLLDAAYLSFSRTEPPGAPVMPPRARARTDNRYRRYSPLRSRRRSRA